MSSIRSQHQATAWVGWIWFAGIVMIMNGCFNAIDGLVALFKDEVFVQGKAGLVVFDFTAWGWILLIIGALQVIVAIALIAGQLWARIVAVGLVTISAIAQIAFITAFPFWSLLVIVLDLLVLWAIIVHGAEAKTVGE